MVTIDLEKAFNSFEDYDFLICVLKNFGFGDNYVNWIKTSLNDQKLCVIWRFCYSVFHIKKGAFQGHPLSAYLFIIALEVDFALIENEVDKKGIDQQNHSILFTA